MHNRLLLLIIKKDIIDSISESAALIKVIESAYISFNNADANIPDRMHWDFDSNTLLSMPGKLSNILGTKLVTVFPKNKELHKPPINGIFVLNSSVTGEVYCIMDASSLTALRTATVSMTAIKHLSYSTQSIGIIGTGVQAKSHLKLLTELYPNSEIRLGGRNKEALDSLKGNNNVPQISISENVDELVKECDVIITVTSALDPLFEFAESDADQNKLFVAVGSYKKNMQELPFNAFKAAKTIVVDTLLAIKECGDVYNPIHKGIISDSDIVGLHEIIIEKSRRQEGIQIFKSVGMSLFDLAVGNWIYNYAIANNLGLEIEL